MIGRGPLRPKATKPTTGGEQGQALVMIAIFVTALVAFAALSIDGGNYYSQRRLAQNASDAGSLRGAWLMATGNPAPSGTTLLRAINAVVEDNGIPDSNGIAGDEINTNVTAYLTDEYGEVIGTIVPGGQPVPTWVVGGVRVELNYPTSTYFAGLMGWTTFPVEAAAMAAYDTGRPKNPFAFSGAAVSMSPDACAAMSVGGGAQFETIGGGIFDNSGQDGSILNCYGLEANGGAGGKGWMKAPDAPGMISVVGKSHASGGATFSPTPLEGVYGTRDFLAYIDPPTCSGTPTSHSAGSGTKTIDPGPYTTIRQSGGTLNMNPGIYCINSTDPKKGFVISGNTTVNGHGVLIYIQHGTFSTAGTSTIFLDAMTSGDWAGLLIFADPTNWDPDVSNARVHISGTSGSIYTGTIYAPVNNCEVTGNGDNLGLYSRIMCDTIEVNGTGLVTINYRDQDNIDGYLPPIVSLYE